MHVCINFSGGEGRRNFLGGFCNVKFSYEEGSLQGMNCSKEILHCGNLPEFLCEISLYALLSLYRCKYRRGDVKGNCLG